MSYAPEILMLDSKMWCKKFTQTLFWCTRHRDAGHASLFPGFRLDLLRRLGSAQHPITNLGKFGHQRVAIPSSHRRGVYLGA
jgi:hypothetical protein